MLEENNFEPIPAGWYEVSISSTQLKQTKTGTGEFIALHYNVLGPDYKGRVIFGKLNIRNPHPHIQDIGIQQLGELMRAIGLASVEDTDQLIGGHLEVKVEIREASGGCDFSNYVSNFRAIKSG
jgi:hypothetical protein